MCPSERARTLEQLELIDPARNLGRQLVDALEHERVDRPVGLLTAVFGHGLQDGPLHAFAAEHLARATDVDGLPWEWRRIDRDGR